MAEELKALSASRIKTLESCSWKYWCNYHLKLPQEQNLGAALGLICHTVLECLALPRRKKLLSLVQDDDSLANFPAIIKIIDKYLLKNDIYSDENREKVHEMILVGLRNDFLIAGKTGELKVEYEFDIINEEPRYRVKGFIDKIAPKGKKIIIDDYKSSKKQFSGEDLESNIQGMTYSLVARKLFSSLTPVVRFIFLQYPKNPIQKLVFKASALCGFEEYLAKIQKIVQNFSLKDAHSHFAADEYPKGDEFAGKLLCGFATKPGEKKKDGKLKWCCPYKFGFKYFVLKNSDGVILSSAFKREDLKISEGKWIEEKTYEGCPRFSKAIDESQLKNEVCTAIQIEL